MAWPALGPGRLLERCGDAAPRGMAVLDRTRLIGRLPLFYQYILLCKQCLHASRLFQLAGIVSTLIRES